MQKLDWGSKCNRWHEVNPSFCKLTADFVRLFIRWRRRRRRWWRNPRKTWTARARRERQTDTCLTSNPNTSWLGRGSRAPQIADKTAFPGLLTPWTLCWHHCRGTIYMISDYINTNFQLKHLLMEVKLSCNENITVLNGRDFAVVNVLLCYCSSSCVRLICIQCQVSSWQSQ